MLQIRELTSLQFAFIVAYMDVIFSLQESRDSILTTAVFKFDALRVEWNHRKLVDRIFTAAPLQLWNSLQFPCTFTQLLNVFRHALQIEVYH
jgi:hypothetical protein